MAQCRCGRCGILCCARDKKNPKGGTTTTQNVDTMPLNVRYENQDSVTISSQCRNDIQKGRQTISIPICDTTTELAVVQQRRSVHEYSPQRLSQYSASGKTSPTPPLAKVIKGC